MLNVVAPAAPCNCELLNDLPCMSIQSKEGKKPDALETTEKYGLEAGLFKASPRKSVAARHNLQAID